MPGSSKCLGWWDQDHIREGFNGANGGEESEVVRQAVGSRGDAVFRLKYCIGAADKPPVRRERI